MKATIKTLSRTLMVLCIAVFAHALTACGNPTITDNNSNGNANSVNNVDDKIGFGSVTIRVSEPVTVSLMHSRAPSSSHKELFIESEMTLDQVRPGKYYVIMTMPNRMTVSQFTEGKHVQPLVIEKDQQHTFMLKPHWAPKIDNVYCQYWIEQEGKYSSGKPFLYVKFNSIRNHFEYRDGSFCGRDSCNIEQYTFHKFDEPNIKGFIESEGNGNYSLQIIDINSNEILHYARCFTDHELGGNARKE